MTISTEQNQVDFTSWYKLWEAAVAINAMCVRHGKAGYWEGIGESRRSSIVHVLNGGR